MGKKNHIGLAKNLCIKDDNQVAEKEYSDWGPMTTNPKQGNEAKGHRYRGERKQEGKPRTLEEGGGHRLEGLKVEKTS